MKSVISSIILSKADESSQKNVEDIESKVNGEIYYGDSLRPSEVNVKYKIDGKYFVRDILWTHIYQNEVNILKITEINTVIKNIDYAGEIFINLQDLHKVLKKDLVIEMDECLINLYYIQDNKRMELYQYEFCCTNEFNFEDYILKLTGRERIEDIPEDILCLRKACFATLDESNKLIDYCKFIFENKNLQEEIKQVFGGYIKENLYAVIY